MDRLDLYFATLAGWMLHPGYLKEGAKAPSLREIFKLAEDMVIIRDEWEHS